MKSQYRSSWFLLGVPIALVALPLLVGCGPTFEEMVANLPDEQRTAVEAAVAMNRARSFEEVDAATTSDATFISSYLSTDGTGKAKFTTKRAYWEALSAKRKGDFASRVSDQRDLQVSITGDTAEVTWIHDVIKKGVGSRDWRGSVDYLFKLRRENNRWKVFYFEQ